MDETRVPGKNHRLASSHWQLSNMPMPGFDPQAVVKDSLQSVAAPETTRPSELFEVTIPVKQLRTNESRRKGDTTNTNMGKEYRWALLEINDDEKEDNVLYK